jgi:hypothetical protein
MSKVSILTTSTTNPKGETTKMTTRWVLATWGRDSSSPHQTLMQPGTAKLTLPLTFSIRTRKDTRARVKEETKAVKAMGSLVVVESPLGENLLEERLRAKVKKEPVGPVANKDIEPLSAHPALPESLSTKLFRKATQVQQKFQLLLPRSGVTMVSYGTRTSIGHYAIWKF